MCTISPVKRANGRLPAETILQKCPAVFGPQGEHWAANWLPSGSAGTAGHGRKATARQAVPEKRYPFHVDTPPWVRPARRVGPGNLTPAEPAIWRENGSAPVTSPPLVTGCATSRQDPFAGIADTFRLTGLLHYGKVRFH